MSTSEVKHQAPHIRVTLTTANGRTGTFWLHNEEETEIAWDEDGDDDTDAALFEVMGDDLTTVIAAETVTGNQWRAIEDSGEAVYVAIWYRRGCRLTDAVLAAVHAQDPDGYNNEYERALEERAAELAALKTTLDKLREHVVASTTPAAWQVSDFDAVDGWSGWREVSKGDLPTYERAMKARPGQYRIRKLYAAQPGPVAMQLEDALKRAKLVIEDLGFPVDASITWALAAAAAASPAAQAAASTPSAEWRQNGEPDPHGSHYDCERAALAMGDLTDDELANGAFLNYDRKLDVDALLARKPGYYPPIAWMTAVKDRIRWLSRSLEKASAAPSKAIQAQLVEAFDACVAAELPRVSHVQYDSHQICEHFAGEVRKRILAIAAPNQPESPEPMEECLSSTTASAE